MNKSEVFRATKYLENINIIKQRCLDTSVL